MEKAVETVRRGMCGAVHKKARHVKRTYLAPSLFFYCLEEFIFPLRKINSAPEANINPLRAKITEA